jgi:hypothetical protein
VREEKKGFKVSEFQGFKVSKFQTFQGFKVKSEGWEAVCSRLGLLKTVRTWSLRPEKWHFGNL